MELARERQRLVYLARLAEQTKRYDEVVESMKEVAKQGVEFTAEERSILSAGCTDLVISRRDSRAILSSIDQRGNNGQQHVKQIMISKIESEVSIICSDIIGLIDEHLIPSCNTVESSVYFYKMKGDFYRYLAEFKTGEEKKEAADLSLKAYEFASKTATEAADMSPGHPIRLGLALNFSVLYYEIMNLPQKASDLARQAFDDASSEIDNLREESTSIMKLLRDNLTFWRTSYIPDDGFKHVKWKLTGHFSPPAYLI